MKIKIEDALKNLNARLATPEELTDDTLLNKLSRSVDGSTNAAPSAKAAHNVLLSKSVVMVTMETTTKDEYGNVVKNTNEYPAFPIAYIDGKNNVIGHGTVGLNFFSRQYDVNGNKVRAFNNSTLSNHEVGKIVAEMFDNGLSIQKEQMIEGIKPTWNAIENKLEYAGEVKQYATFKPTDAKAIYKELEIV